jgi:hypothetical protein
MRLLRAKVGPFKSIREPQTVNIDKTTTVLVGMNEAGKTVFLQAVNKASDALDLAKFDPVEDYPRRDLPAYLKRHPTNAEKVVTLTFQLSAQEIAAINQQFHLKLPVDFEMSLTTKFDNSQVVGMSVDERPALTALISEASLSSDAKAAAKKATSLRGIPDALKEVTLTEPDKTFLSAIQTRVAATKWQNVVEFEVWNWIEARLPKTLYFGEYEVLPSKMNLAELGQRVQESKANPKRLESEHRGILALLRMADIAVEDFSNPGGYETLKAKIEGVSISLTDQIMEFWKQNENLEVEIDIKPDSNDQPPFNNGPNLYLRIKNKRHRGVSTPFRQRSRGFIWFFSFLVWFDSVKHQLEAAAKVGSRDLILLLDEPGLSLHALAQADFLTYIDQLSDRHQVIFTTHSPFMIHSDDKSLLRVRAVEDRVDVGTVITSELQGSDDRTLFPLQAALGWTIAQNLFIGKKNLLIEGPSELVYLRGASALLEKAGKPGLSETVTLVPAGGLDKVATFISLLGANGLDLAVLHDYKGAPDQRIQDLVIAKIIRAKAVLNASQFRAVGAPAMAGKPADIEDLLPPEMYIGYFNAAYLKELGGNILKVGDLPPGDRIIDRIDRWLQSKDVKVRPSGGFNHYRVSTQFATDPPKKFDAETSARFEALFAAVNEQLAS